MTILAYCGEDCDTQSITGATWNTGGTNFRSGYARGAFAVTGGNGDPHSVRFKTQEFSSPSSEFWVSFQLIQSGVSTYVDNVQLVRFSDASGVGRLLIRAVASSTQVKASTRTAAGTIADLATSSGWTNGFSGLRKIDIYVKYAGDGTGQITVYNNGTSVLAYTGANTTDGATALSAIEFGNTSTNASANSVFSEIIVSTTDTRSMALVTLTSSTAGNAQQWTGPAANVNQNSLTNDAQYVYTDVANELQQYKPGSLPAGNWTVEAVCMSARAIRGATGPQNMQFATRIGSTDYTSASVQPNTSFGNLANIQAINPNTSTAWITSDLADTNFQYGVKSIT